MQNPGGGGVIVNCCRPGTSLTTAITKRVVRFPFGLRASKFDFRFFVFRVSRLGTAFAAVVGGGGDSHATEFVGVILAVEDVPLFAAFEDFFFLRRDALAD